jgi:hypothetical protein
MSDQGNRAARGPDWPSGGSVMDPGVILAFP